MVPSSEGPKDSRQISHSRSWGSRSSSLTGFKKSTWTPEIAFHSEVEVPA